MEMDRSDNDRLWFEWPLSERLTAARRWRDVPLSALAVSARPRNALLRSGLWPSVGDLMLAGDEVRSVRGLGEQSLRDIHRVLEKEFASVVPEPVERAGGAGPRFAQARDDGLHALVTMGTYPVEPWYGIRRTLRSAAAAVFRGCPTSRLPIERETADAVASVRRFRSVAALVEGDGADLCEAFPDDVLQQVHEGLRTASRRYLEATIHLPALTLALDQIRRRVDLRPLTPGQLAWPDDVRALTDGLDSRTLGELCRHSAEAIAEGACYEPELLDRLADELRTAAEMPLWGEGVDWERLWADRGVRAFPDPTEPWTVADGVTKLLEMHLAGQVSDRHLTILRHRLGLGGAETRTLAALGDVYGLTRERIRQLERRAKAEAERFLTDDGAWQRLVDPAQLHPELVAAWREVRQAVDACARAPVPERELKQRTDRLLQTESDEVHPLVALAASAGRIRRSTAGSDAGTVWHHESEPIGPVLRRMEAVSRFLTTQTAGAYSPAELTEAMNRAAGPGERLTEADVELALRLTDSVELVGDDRYQGQFDRLRTRLLSAERVLREAGEPLHFGDIAKEINRRIALPRRRHVTKIQLSARMSSDDRFLPIRKTGYWGLAEWPDMEAGTVLDLMERCFIEANRGLTSTAVYDYVAERHDVSHHSILLHLTGDDRFALQEGHTWVLSAWPPPRHAERWTRRALADFLRRYFAERRAERLPLDELVSVVAESARTSEDVARKMLVASPALELAADSRGTVTARYRPVSRAAFTDRAGRTLVRQQIKGRVARRAIEELERRPGHEMMLAELRDMLTEELGISDSSFYAHLSRVKGVEKVPVPGSLAKRVRLVDASEWGA